MEYVQIEGNFAYRIGLNTPCTFLEHLWSTWTWGANDENVTYFWRTVTPRRKRRLCQMSYPQAGRREGRLWCWNMKRVWKMACLNFVHFPVNACCVSWCISIYSVMVELLFRQHFLLFCSNTSWISHNCSWGHPQTSISTWWSWLSIWGRCTRATPTFALLTPTCTMGSSRRLFPYFSTWWQIIRSFSQQKQATHSKCIEGLYNYRPVSHLAWCQLKEKCWSNC